MIHLTSNEICGLRQCMRELEGVLHTLDTAGAGIAAIHVNAAIEQLRKNLDAINPAVGMEDVSILFPEKNE